MQIPCGVARRKRDREGLEPAEPTPALRATPPKRGVFPIPSLEGCRVAAGWVAPSLHPRNDKILLLLPPLDHHRLPRRGKICQLELATQSPSKLFSKGRYKYRAPRERFRLIICKGPHRMPSVSQYVPVPQQPKPVVTVTTDALGVAPFGARTRLGCDYCSGGSVGKLNSDRLSTTVPPGNDPNATVGRTRRRIPHDSDSCVPNRSGVCHVCSLRSNGKILAGLTPFQGCTLSRGRETLHDILSTEPSGEITQPQRGHCYVVCTQEVPLGKCFHRVSAVSQYVPVPQQAESRLVVPADPDCVTSKCSHGRRRTQGPAIGKLKFNDHLSGITHPAGNQSDTTLGGIRCGIFQVTHTRSGSKICNACPGVVERPDRICRPCPPGRRRGACHSQGISSGVGINPAWVGEKKCTSGQSVPAASFAQCIVRHNRFPACRFRCSGDKSPQVDIPVSVGKCAETGGIFTPHSHNDHA